MGNKMYSPTAFFVARWFVSTLVYCFQPLIYSLNIWFFIGIPDDSYDNFKQWLGLALLSVLLVGSACGLLFSTIFRSDMNAIIFVNMFICGLYFSSGVFAKITEENQNWFLDFLHFISPFTYSTEAMMILLLKGLEKKDQDILMEFYQMDKGMEYCLKGIVAIFVTYFVLTWIVIVVKTKLLL